MLLGSLAAAAMSRARFFGRESISLLIILPIARASRRGNMRKWIALTGADWCKRAGLGSAVYLM